MYSLLGSYAQRISDTGLTGALIFCIACIFGCWHLCFFHSRYQQLQSLYQQSRMLTKRIGRLKKTIRRSDQILRELSERTRLSVLQKHHRSLPEALNYAIRALHISGMRVISCKMDVRKEYVLGVGQTVLCELQGSYEPLYRLINSAALTWHECRIILQKEGLRFWGIFGVYAFKGQR